MVKRKKIRIMLNQFSGFIELFQWKRMNQQKYRWSCRIYTQ